MFIIVVKYIKCRMKIIIIMFFFDSGVDDDDWNVVIWIVKMGE